MKEISEFKCSLKKRQYTPEEEAEAREFAKTLPNIIDGRRGTQVIFISKKKGSE